MQLPLFGTDRLLMSPPLWGKGLTHCMLSEGEQRSTELSTQFYAIQIFQDAHSPFQTKSSICQVHETYCAAQDNYWPCKTVKDHCDIHLILVKCICMHWHGQRNFVPSMFVSSLVVLDSYSIAQKCFRRCRKVFTLGQSLAIWKRKRWRFNSYFQKSAPHRKC